MSNKPTLKDFVSGLPVWGPMAIGTALAPTLDQLVSFSLVSDYWQPHLDRTAGVLAGLACVTSYALELRRTIANRQKVLRRSLIIFSFCLLSCILIQILDLPGVVAVPVGSDLVVFFNVVFYVLTFVFFSTVLMGTYFLMFRRTRATGPKR